MSARVCVAATTNLAHRLTESHLAPVYSMAQPPQLLKDETVEHLLAAVDRASPLGKRGLAMLLLAARYGLRSADIRGLRFDHIHWRERRIVLVQSKTQRRLELALAISAPTARTTTQATTTTDNATKAPPTPSRAKPMDGSSKPSRKGPPTGFRRRSKPHAQRAPRAARVTSQMARR